jgi:hypothetical protein
MSTPEPQTQDLVRRLRDWVHRSTAECGVDAYDAADEIERLRAALEIAQQAILEFSVAQERGPQWYTHGADGMYRQVRLWLQKGMDACREALAHESEREFVDVGDGQPPIEL